MHMDLYCLVWPQWRLSVLRPYGQRWTGSKLAGGRKNKPYSFSKRYGTKRLGFLWLVCIFLSFFCPFSLLSLFLATSHTHSLIHTQILTHINQLIVQAMPLLRETAALKAGRRPSVAWRLRSSWQEFNCSFHKDKRANWDGRDRIH